MTKIKRALKTSIITYLTLSIVSIIAVSLITIFISFWMTEQADKDAQAINLSGSMRMQTHHIALQLERGKFDDAKRLINHLSATWNNSLFSSQKNSREPKPLNERFHTAYNHWFRTLRPILSEAAQTQNVSMVHPALVDKQVILTDQLVSAFQKHAEEKVVNLRTFQLFALFITIGVGSIVFYITKNRVEKPLIELTTIAKKIGEGSFGEQVKVEGSDELAQLGKVINEMSFSIKSMYEEMDDRVKERTEKLHQNNITLRFLFRIAQSILDNNDEQIDFEAILKDLSQTLSNNIELELCLFTTSGNKPYLHITAEDEKLNLCEEALCQDCQGAAPFCKTKPTKSESLSTKFPIVLNALSYGVISAKSNKVDHLPEWQEKLLDSVANHFALALSLSDQKDQEYRIAMLNERTVIARELHDSLAQSLSYLQIQATRLQKNHDKKHYDAQQDIINELREGLSSAYRQLRELLTTFRLKMDTGGLRSALDATVQTLMDRTEINIQCHYQVENLPLTASEEIHLLQISREALQNAASHSGGNQIALWLTQDKDNVVTLKVEDNGIGIPVSPEKLNHYGLAIMKERSRHLGGNVSIEANDGGGTVVITQFIPQYIKSQNKEPRISKAV